MGRQNRPQLRAGDKPGIKGIFHGLVRLMLALFELVKLTGS